jgi:hypothetical protein
MLLRLVTLTPLLADKGGQIAACGETSRYER